MPACEIYLLLVITKSMVVEEFCVILVFSVINCARWLDLIKKDRLL